MKNQISGKIEEAVLGLKAIVYENGIMASGEIEMGFGLMKFDLWREKKLRRPKCNSTK